MRALEYQAPERLALVERPEPTAATGQIVVEVANCGICGSDLHSFSHGFAAKPGQILGHEFCGTVLSAPGVEGVDGGDRVTVRPLIPCGHCAHCCAGDLQLCEQGHDNDIGYASPGAFAERVLVPRAVVGETVFQLPPEVDDRAGSLVEPLAVGLRAVNVADPGPGDVVLILGAGTIGLAAARFARLREPGALIVADPSPLRRERAREFGADVVVDPLAEDTTGAVRAITGAGAFGLGARADVVIDCAGAAAGFRDALKSVRAGGTLVLAAMYSGKIELRPDRIVEKGLRVFGTLAYRDEFPAVIAQLADGSVDAERLISHRFALADAEAAFATQLDRDRSLKVLVSPRD